MYEPGFSQPDPGSAPSPIPTERTVPGAAGLLADPVGGGVGAARLGWTRIAP